MIGPNGTGKWVVEVLTLKVVLSKTLYCPWPALPGGPRGSQGSPTPGPAQSLKEGWLMVVDNQIVTIRIALPFLLFHQKQAYSCT